MTGKVRSPARARKRSASPPRASSAQALKRKVVRRKVHGSDKTRLSAADLCSKLLTEQGLDKASLSVEELQDVLADLPKSMTQAYVAQPSTGKKKLRKLSVDKNKRCSWKPV